MKLLAELALQSLVKTTFLQPVSRPIAAYSILFYCPAGSDGASPHISLKATQLNILRKIKAKTQL